MKGKPFYTAGMQLLDAGNFLPALEQFNKALDLEPDQPDYLSDRAVTYFHLNKKDLAIIDLNRAQILDPLNPYRYSSRAFVKDSLGDIDGAIADYEKAVELDPQDAVALNNLGLLEEKKGYLQKANARFKKADELMDVKKREYPEAEKFIPMSENHSAKNNEITDNSKKEKKSSWKHIKYAVFTKAGRREFFSFIKKGFKLK